MKIEKLGGFSVSRLGGDSRLRHRFISPAGRCNVHEPSRVGDLRKRHERAGPVDIFGCAHHWA